MDLRLAAAVTAGKLSLMATRAAGRGGTALPGLIATALDPDIVGTLAAQLPRGSIVVSGTNGKTTTSRLIAGIFRAADLAPIRNETGSNLSRGLASSLVARTGARGDLAVSERTIGLFEVDEAALPEIVGAIQPATILLLDLFRDQLDRYGEVSTIAGLWKEALQALPMTLVVANADDPLIVDVAQNSGCECLYFGLASTEREAELEHAADAKACPRCGASLEYERVFFGHLGHWHCTACALARPIPTVEARDVRLDGIHGSHFVLQSGPQSFSVSLPLPGLYNVYNAVGASSVAGTAGIEMQVTVSAIEEATPAFGRMERLAVDGRYVCVALAKNPAGLNEVLRTLLASGDRLHMLVMLNDNIADGRDVSWIWDADVEMLDSHVESVVFAGTRAEDMALRFKYAGVIAGSDGGGERRTWTMERRTERAFRTALADVAQGDYLFVVPTYTALLDVRSVLARLGYVRPYWEE